jgi:hypothetical protein
MATNHLLLGLKQYIADLDANASILTKEGSAAELARHYLDVRTFYDNLHEVSKELTKLKDQMSYKDIPTAFEREGTTTLTLQEGYRVTISQLVQASTKDMATGIAWLDEHGHGALAKRTINAQTLAAFARSEMEEGRELPEDVFTVRIGQNTSLTKVK